MGGRPYGPYTDAQMAAFAAEGRLAPQSLIARVGETKYRQAGEEAALVSLFDGQTPTPAQRTQQSGVFGRNKDEGQKHGERAHIMVIADLKSGSIAGIEEELYRLGQVCPVLPQIWIVHTDQSVTSVRNTLIQQLGKLDKLILVDATNDKAVWFNFGPELEARLRRIWVRTSETPSNMRATG